MCKCISSFIVKSKIYLIQIIIIMIFLSTMSFALSQEAPQYSFKVSCGDSFYGTEGYTAQRFCAGVEYLSGGKIGFKVFPDAQLGEEQETLEALQLGTIDVMVGSIAKLSSITKKLSLFDTPFLFRGELDQIDMIFESSSKLTPVTEKMLKEASEEAGFHVLSLTMFGQKIALFNVPVRSLEDLEGKKIRLQPSALQLDAWRFLGLNTTTLTWSELYTALQTHVVDGAELVTEEYVDCSFYEVAPYIVVDKHANHSTYVAISEKAWSSLNQPLQNIVKEVAVRAAYLDSHMAMGFTISKMDEAKNFAKGVTVFDEETLKEMRNKVLPKLLDKHGEEIGFDNLTYMAKSDPIIRKWCEEKDLVVQ